MRVFTNSLMVLIVGCAIARTISGVLVNHVIEHFDLVGAAQGYMNSVINAGTMVAVISTIAVRWKAKKASILVFSGLLIAASVALTGLSASSFHLLLAMSLALGVGLGWNDVYTNSCVIDANPSGSAKYQSALQGWYAVGAIAAPLAIAGLLMKTGWQGVYLALAPPLLLIAVIYMVCLRVAGRRAADTEGGPSGFAAGRRAAAADNVPPKASPGFAAGEIRLFLKDRNSLLLIASCIAYYTMQYGLFAWLVRYMSVQHGAEALGMASITIMWVCTSVARFAAPKLPVGNMKLHAFGALAAGATLFVGIRSGSPWIMCAMVGAGALATGNSLPALLNTCATGYRGDTLLPTSAMLLSMQITGMVVPPILGAIAVYSMQGSMLVLVIAAFVSGFIGLAWLRGQRRK